MISKQELEVHPLMDMRKEPMVNVMSVDKFHERAAKIFQITADILGKSYGPYGSATIISNFPHYSVTKDGWAIMKSISYAKDRGLIDSAIGKLIAKPCGRLNQSVGDGTTTAIMAVNAIFQRYMSDETTFKSFNLPPRDLLAAYDRVREAISEYIDMDIRPINNLDDTEKLVKAIRDIAYISSNANEETANMFEELYRELEYPLIEIRKASDGITKHIIRNGYIHATRLIDPINVTNDDKTCRLKNVNVLMYDFKVTNESYEEIIKPLSEISRTYNHKLLVIAPSYDQLALKNISRDVRGEYEAVQGKTPINLILATAQTVGSVASGAFSDLAMLCNTTIISRSIEFNILKMLENDPNERIDAIFNIHHRYGEDPKEEVFSIKNENGKLIADQLVIEEYDDTMKVGYIGDIDIPLSKTLPATFNDFRYNEDLYQKTIDLIKFNIAESNKKSLAINIINVEVTELTSRLHRLGMKMGTIEVGGESIESQTLLYDAIEDTVKATESAYHNGIVSGCSIATLRAINNYIGSLDSDDTIEYHIAKMILGAFEDVYKVLLGSRYTDKKLDLTIDDKGVISDEQIIGLYNFLVKKWNVKFNIDLLLMTIKSIQSVNSLNGPNESPVNYIAQMTMFDLIIKMSCVSNLAFDITAGDFNQKIINSVKTDKEVLLASSDLISLLITGNQLVVADYIDYATQ